MNALETLKSIFSNRKSEEQKDKYTIAARKEAFYAQARERELERRKLRKRLILQMGCDMGNAQALRRRAERRLTGRVVTPLHVPVNFNGAQAR